MRIHKEVLNGVILEHVYFEYVYQVHMCEHCTRVQSNLDQYVVVMQLRKHVSHKRTFFYLEKLILKHGVAAQADNVKQVHKNVDFFFANKSHASKFLIFLGNVVPILNHGDKQLVSKDSKSITYNYKYTFSIQVFPIFKEDLICLPLITHSSLLVSMKSVGVRTLYRHR